MKRIMVPLGLGTVALLLVAVGDAAERAGAKALFHSGEGPTMSASKKQAVKPKVEKYMGIAYWIDLVKPDGTQVRTTTSRVFRSGERIKFNIKTNKDGYLYLLNIGSTGTTRILFPHSGHVDNFVKANEAVKVPFNVHIKFDENPGEETLLVMLSPKTIEGLSVSSPTLNVEESQRYVQYAQSKGAKDLVLETDEAVQVRTAQYAVAPMSALESGSVLTLFIKLKHDR